MASENPIHIISLAPKQTGAPGWPMAILDPYFCPVTGRGVRSRSCRRDGRRLLSPFADVPVQIGGTPLLVIGIVIALVGSVILCREGPIFGYAAGGAFAVVAVLRFARQFRVYSRGRTRIS